MSKKEQTITNCLQSIGVTKVELDHCGTLDEEFGFIKRSYFKKVLKVHPDKGGDPDVFRSVQTSFEVLRKLYTSQKVASFKTSGKESAEASYQHVYADFTDMPTPSWEFYQAAAEEVVPTYRVELAKSGRGTCKQKGKAKKCLHDAAIEKGEIRVGSIDSQSGTYTRWVHLSCWRVPSKIWLGLPDSDPNPEVCTCMDAAKFESALLSMNEVLFCGFNELPQHDREKVIVHIMDKANWAKFVNRKQTGGSSVGESEVTIPAGGGSASTDSKSASTAIIPQMPPSSSFIIPVPGING